MQEVQVVKYSDFARLEDPDARVPATETVTFSFQGMPVQEIDLTAEEYAETSKFFMRLTQASRPLRPEKVIRATDSLPDKRAYRKGLLTWARAEGREILSEGTKNERVRRDTEREYQRSLRPDDIPPKYLLA